MKSHVALAWIAMALGLSMTVRGELIEFEFSGVIASDPVDPDGDLPGIDLNDPFTGVFRYDTDTPELLGGADPSFGSYFITPPFVPLSFTVEGFTFASDPNLPPDILIVNDTEDPDFGLTDQFLIYGATATTPNGIGGVPFEFGMILISTDDSVFSDSSLPTHLDVDDWEGARSIFYGGISSSTGQVMELIGEIDTFAPVSATPELQAGDADQDLDFDQLDLVKVQIAAKYLTGQPATWGEGDWDGAPGGSPGNPPPGDGLFNQLDIVAALKPGHYLTGRAAIRPTGAANDAQTSIVYDVSTGELAVDAPAGVELTSVNIDSAAGIFTGQPARNLGGSFDNDVDTNIFKATFGSSFGSLSFGRVAATGLEEQFLLNDLTVVGSLAGGGDLGDVDLIYVPEPSSALLVAFALLSMLGSAFGRRVYLPR